MSIEAMKLALKPCPFCGSGTTEIKENGKMWSGRGWSAPSSVSVFHWCEEVKGQPSRAIERVGKDLDSAVKAWNLRQAIAEAQKQKPLCTAAMFDEWFLAKSGLDPKTPIYTHPQPKQDNTELDAICQDLQEKTYTQAMRIAELEAKLAEAEKQEPVGYVSWGYEAVWNGKPPKAETDLYTHPQPKREPVAWEQLYPDIGKPQLEYLPASPFDISGKPQPKREPLTDEQIRELFNEHSGYGRSNFLAFARAIEAAHGIKE